MKKIRNISKNPLLIIMLLMTFLSYSTNLNNLNTIKKNNELILKYSGEELFRGIFFGTGQVANKLANFKVIENAKSQLTEEQKLDFLDFQNDIVAYIDKNNPNYFNNLKKAVESKNHIIIRNEFKKSKKVMKNAIQELTSINYSEIEKEIKNQKTNLVIDLDKINELKTKMILDNNAGTDQLAAVCLWVLVVLIAVAIAVYVIVAFDVIGSKKNNSTSKILENENLINSLTQL